MSLKLDQIRQHVEKIQNTEKKQYVIDLLDAFGTEKQLIAYHASCPDGSITAALLKHYEPDKQFIPLDYNVLKDSQLRQFICDQNWYAILDLEPFNTKPMELFVDHHRSVIGSLIKANRIHFEVGIYGPSAAFVLYNSLIGIHEVPNYLKELVEVSKITDTASFAIDPPSELVSKEEKWHLDDFDKLCWFVQDATSIEEEFSLQKNNEIISGLEQKGTGYLLSEERIRSVNKQRKKRLLGQNFIDGLSISELMVILNVPDSTIKQYLALKIGKIGAKVIVFFSQKDSLVTISLRQSKMNSVREIERFRLDLLAKKFNESGGGHAEAAGSISSNMNEAIDVIKKWAREKELKSTIVEYYDK